MNYPLWLIVMGAIVYLTGLYYDKRYGRSEEYGPMVICVAGMFVIFIGALCLLWRWASSIALNP